jgi:hypothetical protein
MKSRNIHWIIQLSIIFSLFNLSYYPVFADYDQSGLVQPGVNRARLSALPVITVWYEASQQFGQLGNPQTQVNLLGNVRDTDGSIASLSFRLNGGSSTKLSIGPDTRRLANAGDFNIAINTSSLINGTNNVVITAVDNNGDTNQKAISFKYTWGKTWTLPYTTSWLGGGSIHSQAQVIDGLWQTDSLGVHPVQVGYDRLIAVGDIAWTNYEVLVPVTIHSFTPDPSNPSDAGGVGVIVRWQGHIGTGQLPDGWTQIGAYGYYSNRVGALALRLNDANPVTQNFSIQYNHTYLIKLKAETVALGGRYSLKMWQKGQPEPAWTDTNFNNVVNVTDTANDLLQGAVLLVAHRTDSTFGDITVCPPNTTYTLSVSVTGSGTASSVPAKSVYQCAEGVTLTATPKSGWVFKNWSGDISTTSNPLSINLIRNQKISANFVPSTPQNQNFSAYFPTVSR